MAPTKYAPIFRKDHDGESIIQYATWGLIPFWTKKKQDADQSKTFNARKESVISGQKLWAPVRKHSRCVVPIEGYYEWLHKPIGQSKKIEKIPYYLRRKDKKLIFLAGLYDNVNYQDTPDDKFQSFTIITGPAPKQTKWLHERMPIVLEPGTKEWDLWLDNTKEWDDSLGSALKEYGKDDLEWFEVSKDVGKVSNDGEYLVKPLKKGGIGDFFSKNKKPETKEVKKEDDVEKDEKQGDVINGLKNQNANIKEEKEEVKSVEEDEESKSDVNDEEQLKKEPGKDIREDSETKHGTKREATDDSDIGSRVRQHHKKIKN
ncbi:hypothetical protein BN7_678 [Wickerhamomyces ciferrii]|uniref:DUF159-domain-containing protein n=1 Tax=Wickerhamomyces ciferrii (strain ATCC 14091 / BCRC 22168 / CBS 111 / JCM 3599 / NBRC 0793 / NRRL Y-1031 F-60-10) TaxID=1206466 RepID=K0KDY6_WICCF|nr:uncharacterized protein BN7_678 [Wickerhamomyces ciferrii]CCH41141.1 hypothetical protein BN7_678 [Wickerhamomyces ciferrii]